MRTTLAQPVGRFAVFIAFASLFTGMALVAPARAGCADIRSVRDQLADLRANVRRVGRAYEQAYWRLDETEVRLRATEGRLAQTETRLARARTVLAERAASMYRSAGGIDYLAVLLGSATFQEVTTRIEFMRRVGMADADALARVLKLSRQLQTERRVLERERTARRKASSKLRKRRDALRSRLEQKQAEYELLVARLSASQRRAAGVGAPRGPHGLVFPVAGVRYYGDTWGASRAGGRRRHKGTDIMAARGTPVVAALSGYVQAKTSGLGGKTIWLRADNGWVFFYAHLSGWAVTSGHVSAGRVIGYVGNTGNARGGSPHLHFEVHPGGGGAVNPYPYLREAD